ncbi:helix-turn-helix domain-containing protein [Pyxidicoccus xibeiensis]|uniref:helix-turn-helix domain-containing protein n=1 Tax=Pyxidicoccus xibeiensis TaxID=2906759 RepID=UPI003899D152
MTGDRSPFAAPLLQGAAGATGAPLLTVRAVAAQLAVSRATVYGLCKRGQLRSIRVSGALRIDPASVGAFISASRDALT